MREGRKWLQLLVAALMAGSLALAGCSGDDGSDGRDGTDGADFALPAGENVGLLNCSTCHGSSTAAAEWSASAHANQGDHTANTCAIACHNPNGENAQAGAAFGVSSPMVVGCESCHGGGSGHFGVGAIPNAAPGTAECAKCHDGDQHAARHVFASEIASRFETSRHANQSARAALCSACHSHEGGIQFLAMGRKTSREQLATSYNEATASAYMLPVGSDTIVGVMKKTCATCHDPHKAELRGDGDVLASSANVTGFTATAGTPIDGEARVAYSAEFNLCTACHMVDLDATWDATAGYSSRGMIRYELSGAYSAANLIDATSNTYDMSKAPFYHDGASGNGRTMVDTHFGGTILSHLVDFAGGADDIQIKGYNINPGSKNACTICHDPHTGGKMLSIDSSSTIDYADQLDNKVVSYAEGLGDFHTNYLGDAFSRNQTGASCAPCHTGDKFVEYTTRGTAAAGDQRWNVVGCRTCHDLAVPNAGPGVNNAEAFAQVREFTPTHTFAFNSGAEVPVADLGVNQICFECHKGRTPGISQADFEALTNTATISGVTYNGTQNYTISYLHYAPSFAILYGADSQMVSTYPGKTYAGRFSHVNISGGSTPVQFGCVDCHDVHNTEENHAANNKMTNPEFSCSGCHGGGTVYNVPFLQARTQAFSEALLDAVLVEMQSYAGDTTLVPVLQTKITALAGTYPNANFATAEDELMDYIQQRQVYFPTPAIAKAATTWKVFTYEDGAPHGQTHGHGGSWAHNSRFARQMMFDAIESLSVNPNTAYGLTRP